MGKRSRKKQSSASAPAASRLRTRNAAFPGWEMVLLRAAVIIALGFWIYAPALHGDWLWDDDWLIGRNSLIHDPDGLRKIWFAPTQYLIDYFPLKVSVEWLEWQLWRNDTFNYHLLNVILHVIGALLIWRLLAKLGVRLAWLGGLIFVVHPIAVESVAWISELKNTLSLPLFLLAMCSFVDYDERGRWSDYLQSIVFFLLAMFAKTTMVTFPIIILLYAWWKRGRIGWKDLKTSAPFFVVSLALGLATIWFLHAHAIDRRGIPMMGGVLSRIALGGLSIAFYFGKCVLPVGLLPVYPRWIIDPPSLFQFLPWLVLPGALAWLWTKRETWGRHALLGFGFFLITLGPFIGFTPGSYMTFTWVMDHFLYIPVIGLIGLAAAAAGQIGKQLPPSYKPAGIGLIVIAVGCMAWGSHSYAAKFASEKEFWGYAAEHNPQAWIAHGNLALALFKENRLDEAIRHYQASLVYNPDFAESHYGLANCYRQTNQLADAEREYKRAIEIEPTDADIHNNLGGIYAQQGRFDEAIGELLTTLKLNPNNGEVHANLGGIYAQQKRINEAIAQFQESIRLNPNYAPAHASLALTYSQMGRTADAIAEYEAALRIDPNDAGSQNQLAQLRGHSAAITPSAAGLSFPPVK